MFNIQPYHDFILHTFKMLCIKHKCEHLSLSFFIDNPSEDIIFRIDSLHLQERQQARFSLSTYYLSESIDINHILFSWLEGFVVSYLRETTKESDSSLYSVDSIFDYYFESDYIKSNKSPQKIIDIKVKNLYTIQNNITIFMNQIREHIRRKNIGILASHPNLGHNFIYNSSSIISTRDLNNLRGRSLDIVFCFYQKNQIVNYSMDEIKYTLYRTPIIMFIEDLNFV